MLNFIVKRQTWMDVIARRDYFVALTVFNFFRGMAPTYISDCITICNEIAIRDTRNSTSTNLVRLPYASLDIFKNSFAYRGTFIWNALGPTKQYSKMCHSLLFQNSS